MLYIPGMPDSYSAELDRVLSRASVETTPDGFEYYVSDPNDTMGLTMGCVRRTPEQSELTIIVNGNVQPEDREKIATTAVVAEGHLESERYWLARALYDVVSWKDDDEFNANIFAINLIADGLRHQSTAIQRDPTIDQRTKARLRDEARSALGILATYRGVTTDAKQVFTEFSKKGLQIPHSDTHELELAGRLQTKNGPVTASFKAMEEKSERHNCACCSAQIIRGTNRVTLGLDKNDGYSDHHHYHYACFVDTVMPKLDFESIVERPLKIS
jgi:hypothetical protein